MPVRPGAVRLQARDDPHGEVALAGQCAHGGGHGAGGDAGDLAEQAAAVQTVGAEPLGDGEHHLAVRHRREQCRVQPLRPDRQPLGVTAGAAVAARAREREQIRVRARLAAAAGEPAIEHAAGEELVGHLRDDGAPRAVLACEALVVDGLQALQVIRHQPKQRRRLGPSGLVDAARSGTGERRAYGRLGGWRSPFRCATGHSDATSGFAGLTMLAVAERTDHPRSVKPRVVRSLQKPALGVRPPPCTDGACADPLHA